MTSPPSLYLSIFNNTRNDISLVGDEGIPSLNIPSCLSSGFTNSEVVYMSDVLSNDLLCSQLISMMNSNYIAIRRGSLNITTDDVAKYRQGIDVLGESYFGGTVVSVDGTRTDSYLEDGSFLYPYKTIQGAIDAITDQSSSKKYVVSVAPATYAENVVLKRFVSLVGVGAFGPSKNVVIQPASGVALKVPYGDVLVSDLSCISDSGVAVEAGCHVFDDGLGVGDSSTFFLDFLAAGYNGSRGVWVEPNPSGEPVVFIWAALEGNDAGTGVYVDGAGIIWFGGGGSEGERGIHLVNGAFAMLGSHVGVNADETSATAWAIEADASYAIILDATIAAYNGVDVKNGALCFLIKAQNMGGFTGIAVSSDVTSVLILGPSVVLDTFGAVPWSNWSVLGTSLKMPTACEGYGTTGGGGPDQRPTAFGNTPPLDYSFLALDIALGAGVGTTLKWNGAQWVDTAGNVVP